MTRAIVAALFMVGVVAAAQPVEAQTLPASDPSPVTNVIAPPTIALDFTQSSIPVGSTAASVDFTINAAAVATTGIGFVDTLPAGLELLGSGSIAFCGGTLSFTAPSTISLSGAALAPSGGCAIGVTVKGTTPGVKADSVTVTSDQGTGNTAMASITVVGPPSVSKSFGVSSVPVGGSTSLSFTVSAPAENTVDVTGVGFTDTLPAGLVVSTPNGLSGSCGGGTITAVAGSSGVSLSGASLAPGGSCSFSVSVTGTTSGLKTNSVQVTSTNGATGNTAMASLTVTDVVGPPSVSEVFGVPSVPVGGSTSLSFTVSAPPGNSVDLAGVGFTDTLPAGLVVSTPNGLSGSCGGGTITAVAGSSGVSLSGASLAPGGSCSFSVSVTGTTSGLKTNPVQVTSTNGGTGNTATASITVTSVSVTSIGVCVHGDLDLRAPYADGTCPSSYRSQILVTVTSGGVAVCVKTKTDWRSPASDGACPSGYALVRVDTVSSGGEPACTKVNLDVRAPDAAGCPSGFTPVRFKIA